MKWTAVSCVALFCAGSFASEQGQRTLTLPERVEAQKAIEKVYWSHRIWPKENPSPKPSLAAVMSDAAIRERVEDDLRMSMLLDTCGHDPITSEDIQAEMSRMARQSQAPDILRELFGALHDDPLVIAECLARPTLARRRAAAAFALDEKIHRAQRKTLVAWVREATASTALDSTVITPPPNGYAVPLPAGGECSDDTWTPTAGSEVPDRRRGHSAVWTGSEMIIWGGFDRNQWLSTGARYTPATDSWIVSSLTSASGENVPQERSDHTAVWTGTEMIVWGGSWYGVDLDTGGRYNPITDTWASSSLTHGSGANVPPRQSHHTAVWTGSEMIVWGGSGSGATLKTGGRYNPVTDAWASSSLTSGSGANVPGNREGHTAVWTGSEMVVWGGYDGADYLNTGGRYNPTTDTWASSSLTTGSGPHVPAARDRHSAVWTGSEMIVWGGSERAGPFNTGGRYDPITDTWAATSLETGSGANVAAARALHSAVWTGTDMIVWGGYDVVALNSGGLYNPVSDSWAASTLTTGGGANVAARRSRHTAVWTGSEMIVWGGYDDNDAQNLDSGGRYDPVTDGWSASILSSPLLDYIPTANFDHTSVWTGSEMIVWGGFLDGGAGGRYDPATDSWAPSSLTTAGPNTPTARSFHTAVWTGLEMIVWGGYGNDNLNDGGRYNPTTDTWAATSLTTGSGANVPLARQIHTAVWTGSEMIVWGGYGGGNTGGRYDPFTDTWAATSLLTGAGANVPSFRAFHTAVWTGSEMIVWGGYDGSTFPQTGGRYNPVSDTWAASSLTTGSGANAPAGGGRATAIWTGSELIVWGGGVNKGGLYDPVTDTWAASSLTTGSGPNVPSARSDHTAVWTGSEMIVWGGGGGGGYLITGGRYNPYTDSWAALSLTTGSGPSVPAARVLHTAVWTGSTDHRMIVWGGLPFTRSGGVYCAVCAVLTWHRDLDGDGHGNPGITQSSCAPPAGYIFAGDDCDDTNPTIHPGAGELCNGIDDDCDSAADDGGDTLCNDANFCTADVCRGAIGCGESSVDLDTEGYSTARVDGRDLVVLADAWNSCPGDPRYDPAANLDGVSTMPGACVGSTDFHLFMGAFGHSCP